MRKQERLKKGFQFKRAYQQGKSYRGEFLTLFVVENGLAAHRLGISMGARVKKSTRRNRVRRVFREAFRRNKDKVAPGYDFILVAKEPCFVQAGPLRLQEAERELLRLLARAGLFPWEGK